ncbi:MAG: ABC transporter ATP-binding protein, partial [Bacillota bacterium]|nr:ABC transporter ATP-binding protein [Bacillota bacterium]
IGMIFGLLRPTTGEVVVNGIPVVKEPEKAKACLGYVPQEIALYPELTAAENLTYWGRMYGLGGAKLTQRVAEVLEIVGLSDRAKSKIETFSGGMKRRVNIAAALLHEPKVLIMDEPTVGVDPQSRNHILETVKKLNAAGLTIVYTSHYMEEVEYLCTRIGIIDHGKIIAEGTVPDLRRIVGEVATLALQVSSIPNGMLLTLQHLSELNTVVATHETLQLTAGDAAQALAAVTQVLADFRVKLRSVDIKEANLEAVFLHLTGRALRD